MTPTPGEGVGMDKHRQICRATYAERFEHGGSWHCICDMEQRIWSAALAEAARMAREEAARYREIVNDRESGVLLRTMAEAQEQSLLDLAQQFEGNVTNKET